MKVSIIYIYINLYMSINSHEVFFHCQSVHHVLAASYNHILFAVVSLVVDGLCHMHKLYDQMMPVQLKIGIITSGVYMVHKKFVCN